jgi:hypothetical protein
VDSGIERDFGSSFPDDDFGGYGQEDTPGAEAGHIEPLNGAPKGAAPGARRSAAVAGPPGVLHSLRSRQVKQSDAAAPKLVTKQPAARARVGKTIPATAHADAINHAIGAGGGDLDDESAAAPGDSDEVTAAKLALKQAVTKEVLTREALVSIAR